MRVFGIVPAAGSSTRMGASNSKALLPLGAELVIERTLRVLADSERLSHIVLVVPEHEQSAFQLIRFPSSISVTQVVGGKERQDSVRNALNYLARTEKPASTDLVLVHDAARPLLTPDLIRRCIDAAEQKGATTAALPAVETVKRVSENGKVIETLKRAELWSIQTPQVFRWDLLMKAHETDVAGATDDASMVEPFHPVHVVNGERWNLKLTNPEDYDMALLRIADSEER